MNAEVDKTEAIESPTQLQEPPLQQTTCKTTKFAKVGIIQYFVYSHLPKPLQKVSAPIGDLALLLSDIVPEGPQKEEGLKKLLEAKDCFVRASLP